MPTLSSNIVKHNVASVRDVEEALSRQAVYGGDLATNLLELAAVSEQDLTRLLAESYGLEPAPVGELPVAAERVRRLVSGELALRHGTYPLEERGGILALAVSEPLPPEVENDLSFSLGAMIEQRIAPLVRIKQAIARDYGVPLDRRTERVLAKLAGKPDPNPSYLPPNAERPDAPAPSTTTQPIEPTESRRAPAPTLASATAPPLTSTLPERTSAAPRVSIAPDLGALAKPSAKAKRRPRRLGPYTPAMAEKDLLAAEARDDVLRAFFDFAAQYFEYAALFAIHGDLAEGRDAAGSGASRARVIALGVPLDLPGALSRVVESQTFELVRLGSSGLDAALAKDLERRPGPAVLLLPVLVRGRCVLVLYGDHGDADVELGAIGDVISFVPLVSKALERLIVKKKLQNRGDTASLPSLVPPLRSKNPLPSAEERAAALASALERKVGPARSPAPPQARAAGTAPAAPATATSPAPPAASVTAPPTPEPKAPTPAPPAAEPKAPTPAAPAAEPKAPAPTPPAIEMTPSPAAPIAAEPAPRPESASSAPPRRATPQRDGALPFQPTVAVKSPSPAPVSSEPPPPSMPRSPFARPVISVGIPSRRPAPPQTSEPPPTPSEPSPAARTPTPTPPAPRTQTPSPASARRLELVAEVQTDTDDDAPDISHEEAELDASEFDTDDGVPLAPASRSLAHSARPPPRREDSAELHLPSVIVDLTNDCRMLLARLLEGDASAGDKLVQVGGPAVTVLVAAFPGPITSEARRGVGENPPKASDCGPVLRTLARIGVSAVPVIVVRTADADPHVRAWATRLLGEMPTEEAARAVVRRFTDENADVRRAALAAGRLLQMHPETGAALHEGLADLLFDPRRDEDARHTLIESLADLRDGRAVPTLIRLLQDPSSDVVRSAQWALGVIAHQDFGNKPAVWEEWWRQNAQRHRIEWLIDSLMHESQDVRRAAGDELKALTKEYFGYYDDLPVKERLRAQERYREWWETKGKARFR